jgi:hypothetical protein
VSDKNPTVGMRLKAQEEKINDLEKANRALLEELQ